jgi:hypothetical protein
MSASEARVATWPLCRLERFRDGFLPREDDCSGGCVDSGPVIWLRGRLPFRLKGHIAMACFSDDLRSSQDGSPGSDDWTVAGQMRSQRW